MTEWWEGTPVRLGNGKDSWGYGDDRSKDVVWMTPLPRWGNAQPLPVGDRVFALCDPRHLVCVDANTGQMIWEREVLPLELAATGRRLSAEAKSRGGTGGGPVVAGRHNFYIPKGDGNGPKGRTRPDGAHTTACHVADRSDPRSPRLVRDRNVPGGPELPADLHADRHLAGSDKRLYLGTYKGNGSWFAGRNGGVYPSGNREFIQSTTHLYCIGDPAVPFDRDPSGVGRRDRPVQAGQRPHRAEDAALDLLPR